MQKRRVCLGTIESKTVVLCSDIAMKSLAIIGASYLQRPVVERAKQMGLRTICFSWPQGAVCRDLCDVFYPISITEKDEILRVCREEHIDGICTIASDVAAPTVAYVVQRMGLPGNNYEAACKAHDKHLMREVLTAAGVDCPKYQVVSRGEQVTTDGLALPLIVKPTDRSGSLGVQKITNWDQLAHAIQEAEQVSIAGEALVEEFIEGREISVEMISQGGTHHALQITDKTTTGAPHFVELAHHQPSSLPAEMQTRIFDITRKALDALGITAGASHSEYKITSAGRIVVMEIAGRMGGDFIGSDLVQLSTGYDFLRGVIEVALGEKIHVEVKALARSSVEFVAGQELTCSADRKGYIIYRNDEIYKQSVGSDTDL